MSVQTYTDESFSQEVENGQGVTLVDFWAPWCGPCKQQGPIVDELADETTNAKVGKINVDENQATSQKYGVMSIPTLIIFKDGKAVETLVGLHQKEDLKAKLDAHTA